MTDIAKSTQALKAAFDKHYERITRTQPSWRTEAAERVDSMCAHDVSIAGGIDSAPYPRWKNGVEKRK